MTLIIRADTSPRIGAGHVMRCLALGQAWQDAGGQVVFVVALATPPLEERLGSEGIEVVRLSEPPGSADDAFQTAHLARKKGASWVVVDGYHFGLEYQRIIKDSNLRLLFIDDSAGAEHYVADLILNQNLHAREELYAHREPDTQLLPGSQFVLLRREFLTWRTYQRQIPAVARKLLVTMGGGDSDNVTLKVIEALKQVEGRGLEILVVVGGSNPHHEVLHQAMQGFPHAIRLERNVSDMPKAMGWADLAISGGGSTCWEMAFMGLPMMAVVLAENQEPIAESLALAGAALDLGLHHQLAVSTLAANLSGLLTDPERRSRMSLAGRQLIDGFGAGRVIKFMNAVAPRQMRKGKSAYPIPGQ